MRAFPSKLPSMPQRESKRGCLTIRMAGDARRVWKDVRSLAVLLQRHRGRRVRLKSGPTTSAALSRRAFSSLRASLLELCRREGIPREAVEAVLLPNPHQGKAGRAARVAALEASKHAPTSDGAPAVVAGKAERPAPASAEKKSRGRVQWHRPEVE